jgi:hypothetical protein
MAGSLRSVDQAAALAVTTAASGPVENLPGVAVKNSSERVKRQHEVLAQKGLATQGQGVAFFMAAMP